MPNGSWFTDPVRAPWFLVTAGGDLGGELGAGGDVELGEHVGQVGLHRPAGNVQAIADLRVGQPVGDQARDGLLGRREAEPAGLRPAARSAATAADAGFAQARLDASQVTAGVKVLVELQRLLDQRARQAGLASRAYARPASSQAPASSSGRVPGW